MVVASCWSIFILSDVVSDRALMSFRFSTHDLISIRVRRERAVGCRRGLARGAAHPDPAQPMRAPGAPAPHARPHPLSLSFFLSCAATSLSLSSTSPCPRLDSGERLSLIVKPRGELSFSSLLSLFPSPLPVRSTPTAPSPDPLAPRQPRPRRGPRRGPGARSPVPDVCSPSARSI
jgi:hypothetical protein